MSSKENHGFGALSTYGFRGEALASISTMGLVDITSREPESDTVTKILKKGEALYLGPSKRELGRTRGTNVTVRDLFQGVPVRQAELAAASSSSVIFGCKKVIESLALAHPQVRWVLWTNGSRGMRKALSLQGCSSTLEAFKELYGAAGVEKVQHVRVSAGPRRIDGFISLEGGVTRAHQHLFINGYPIENSALHQIISKRFARSPFGSMASDLMDDAPMGGKRPSTRRLERYPVYVLNLTLPADEVDASYEPSKMTLGYKDFDSVQRFLLNVVEDFLSSNGFVGVNSQRETTPGPSTPRSVVAWSTRSGKRARIRSTSPTLTRNVRRSMSRAPDESLNRLYEARIKPVEAALQPASGGELREPEEYTGRNLIQDLIAVGANVVSALTCQAADDGVLHIGRASTAVGADEQEDPTTLTRSLPGPEIDISLSGTTLRNASVLRQVDRKFIPCVLEADGRKTLAIFDQHAADERASLEMILENLCRSFAEDTMTTAPLEEGTVRLVLSRREVEHLETPGVRPLLHRWGIRLGPAQPDGDYAQVNVYAVPELLERLARKQGTELTRLLRLYLPEAAEGIREVQALITALDQDDRAEGDGKRWSGVMRWMPREMLELAKSKACRGAVMFEDQLDRDQCERLVSRLASTRNPWACAHGRPTVVPLCVVDRAEPSRRPIDWAKVAAEPK